MKSSKVIATVVIAMLSVAFAMSDSGGQQPVKPEKKTDVVLAQSEQEHLTENAVLSKTDGIDRMKLLEENEKALFAGFEFLKPINMPEQDKLKMHYESYKQKYFKLGLGSIDDIPLLYKSRVNLDAIEKFKSIGIDLYNLSHNNYSGRHGLPLKPTLLFSQVVVLGTVVDSLNYPFYDVTYHDSYVIKVDKFLKGQDYYKTLPDYIQIFTREGKKQGKDGEILKPFITPPKTRGYEINKQYVFILGKPFYFNQYDDYKKNVLDRKDKKLSERDNYLKKLFEPTSFEYISRNIDQLDSIQIFLQEIKQINDTKNFFKRELK